MEERSIGIYNVPDRVRKSGDGMAVAGNNIIRDEGDGRSRGDREERRRVAVADERIIHEIKTGVGVFEPFLAIDNGGRVLRHRAFLDNVPNHKGPSALRNIDRIASIARRSIDDVIIEDITSVGAAFYLVPDDRSMKIAERYRASAAEPDINIMFVSRRAAGLDAVMIEGAGLDQDIVAVRIVPSQDAFLVIVKIAAAAGEIISLHANAGPVIAIGGGN